MLTATSTWLNAANAGTSKPVVLVEISPTVLSAEVSTAAGWGGGTSLSNVNINHPTGELRLSSANIAHPEKQETSSKLAGFTFYHNSAFEENSGAYAKDRYSSIGQFIQTFTVERGARLRELWLGAYSYGYKGRLIVRLFSGLRGRLQSRIVNPSFWHDVSWQWAVDDIYSRAELLLTLEADFSAGPPQGASYQIYNGQTYLVFDLTEMEEAVYLPGDSVCAVDLMTDRAEDAEKLALFGASGGTAYTRGQLYEHNHTTGDSYDRTADLGLRMIVDGYSATGSGIWELDLGETPAAILTGEIELRYCTPSGTTLSFQVREKAAAMSSWGSWRAAVDGAALTGLRYVQVRATFGAVSDQLDSPRIYGIRASYKRSDKFCISDTPVEGCPHLVLSAPDYTAEGNPLEGKSDLTDTSQIELADPSGMLRRMFAAWDMKNDTVTVSLGFQGLDFDDYLPLKTLWIEDWEPREGSVIIHCYDQQSRLINVDIPELVDPPQDTEQIHFSQVNPADIKLELLQRSRIRPSYIDTTGLTALEAAFAWELSRDLPEPAPAAESLQALNRHLLAFDYTDESGQWKSPYVDFGASPVATIETAEIEIGSEQFLPGWRSAKTVAAVFFGGEGDQEKTYPSVALVPDEDAAERMKEVTPDKLFSEWIPEYDDAGDINGGIAIEVGRRRLTLTRNGLRAISWSTIGLARAPLQIGDHIYLYSELYSRPGASSTNPLLVLITRKHLDPGLGRINWGGIVLLDAGETALSLAAIAVPTGFGVVDNGNGTVTWSWTAATGDGTTIAKYRLFRRKWSLTTWGAPSVEVEADGSATYTLTESYNNTLAYDFGIQAVHRNGRVSAMTEVENVQVTNNLPSAPVWSLRAETGGWSVTITTDAANATEYIVERYIGDTRVWDPVGASIPAPRVGRKVKAGGTPGHWFLPAGKTGPEYGRFRVRSRNSWGLGTASAEQATHSKPYQGTVLASSTEPTLPAESGTYPTLTKTQVSGGDVKFRVLIKVLAAVGYEDYVSRYEMQRRDNEGCGVGLWNAWKDLPPYVVTVSPAPPYVLWTNSDAILKPGVTYQWRARSVALDGTSSAWSTALEKAVTDDTTPPDKPVITSATAHPLGIELVIQAPTQGGGTITDFSHFKVEGWEASAGEWVIRNGNVRTLKWVDPLAEAAMAQSWKHRVTAYDRQGNASTVSDESGFVSPAKVGTGALSSGVNATLSSVSSLASTVGSHTTSIGQNAEAITFKAESSVVNTLSGDVSDLASDVSILAGAVALAIIADGRTVSSFVANVSGLRLKGASIELDGNTVFNSDVVIQGVLAANGMIKTSTGTTRMEIGYFGDLHELRTYSSDKLALTLGPVGFMLFDPTQSGQIRAAEIFYSGTGGGIKVWGEAQNTVMMLLAEEIQINAEKVLGPRLNGITAPSGGSTVDAEARAAIVKIIARIKATGGHGLVDDTEA